MSKSSVAQINPSVSLRVRTGKTCPSSVISKIVSVRSPVKAPPPESRSAMIMNRASLPIAPAKNQSMVRQPRPHQIAAIAFGGELNKRADFSVVQTKPLQPFREHFRSEEHT